MLAEVVPAAELLPPVCALKRLFVSVKRTVVALEMLLTTAEAATEARLVTATGALNKLFMSVERAVVAFEVFSRRTRQE